MIWSVRNQNESRELYHYGVLGMKWGIRRTPEQLGRVRKGTKLYRVTPNKNESEEGSTYVTYLPQDRDMYRGAFARQGGFASYYKIDPDDPLYESVYKLKKDLKVAGFDEQKRIVNRLVKQNNSKIMKNLAKNYVDEQFEKFEGYKDWYKRLLKEGKTKAILSEKDLQEGFFGEATTHKKEVDKVLKDFGSMDADELYRAVSTRFGTEQALKESVITELKNKGYNAMIDQASVKGGKVPIEGYAPLIIFDRGEVMSKLSSKKISERTMEKANERYMNWRWTVNADPERVKKW